jgi:hypothetical protein
MVLNLKTKSYSQSHIGLFQNCFGPFSGLLQAVLWSFWAVYGCFRLFRDW